MRRYGGVVVKANRGYVDIVGDDGYRCSVGGKTVSRVKVGTPVSVEVDSDDFPLAVRVSVGRGDLVWPDRRSLLQRVRMALP